MSNHGRTLIRLCALCAALTLGYSAATAAGTAESAKETVFLKVGEAELAQIKANLVAAGVSEENAAWLVSLKILAGKTARQVGPNIFLGDAPAAGDYQVVALHTPPSGKALLFIGYYQGRVLTRLDLSGGRVVWFQPGGSLQDYTVNLRRNDGKRLWLADYRRGQAARTLTFAKYNDPAGEKVTFMEDVPVRQAERLELYDFGVALTSDARGDLTASCRSLLQAGGDGWQYRELPGRGFALTSLITGREELFSPEGRRMGAEGPSLKVAQREAMLADASEWMTLQVPIYQDPATVRPPSQNPFGDPTWETVQIETISRRQMEVCIQEDASLLRIVSTSDVLAGDPLVVWERGRIEQGQNSVRWDELRRELATATRREVPPPPAVDSLAAHVTRVNFFECPAEGVPHEKRYYTELFAAHETRYIGWEINFSHPAPGTRVKFKVKAVWTEGSGRQITAQTAKMTMEPDWTVSFLFSSWGAKKPGSWAPGVYSVTFYVEGERIGAGSFSVY
jgi:hypothetical protein